MLTVVAAMAQPSLWYAARRARLVKYSVPTDSMVSWWKFDGNGLDSFGTNNVALINSPVLTNGVNGSAYYFSGTSYASVSNQENFIFSSGFSISFWMKTQDTNACDLFVKRGPTDSGWYSNYEIHMDSGKVRFLMGNSSNTGYGINLQEPVVVNDGNWNLVSCVVSGTTAYIYVNSTLATNAAISSRTTNIAAPTMARRIGGAVTQQYTGFLDEVRVWRRYLTGQEVLSLYNEEKP